MRWAPRYRPGQARSFKSRMPMSFAPPMRSVPGHHCISGHGRCSARHPCRIQPPKCVHGQKGEVNAAKSKNGNAGWNPGTAIPERIGAKPERLAPGRCGLNVFHRARGISALPHLHFLWHARKGTGTFFLWSRLSLEACKHVARCFIPHRQSHISTTLPLVEFDLCNFHAHRLAMHFREHFLQSSLNCLG